LATKKQYPRHGGAKKNRVPSLENIAETFSGILKSITPLPDKANSPILKSSPLVHLDYETELQVKNKGLKLFWEKYALQGKPEEVFGSPRARGYRTTSKRKTILKGNTLHLILGEKGSSARNKEVFTPSPLEPVEHERIYLFLQKKLSESPFKLLARHLNYLIIRGNYSHWAVIFNIDKMNGPIVHKLKLIAGHLQKLEDRVSAAFIYFDPTHSDYYLESRRPSDSQHFKKLFGQDLLSVTHHDCKYRFHPTSFSQVNESIVPIMLNKVREMLAPARNEKFLDLYCGYGLFSHFLAPEFKQVTAFDFEGKSIQAAKNNYRLNKKRGGKSKFFSSRIDARLLNELAGSAPPQAVLLDPPRQGPAPGVIAGLSLLKPEKVLHIFCNVDQIPISIKQWRDQHYEVRRIIPLDMFPGSANLEIMILLSPKK
jgi:tRNA/tmRNA/rRNA uracil-C5-methylase (TrmA/RlmC/RlmD family)